MWKKVHVLVILALIYPVIDCRKNRKKGEDLRSLFTSFYRSLRFINLLHKIQCSFLFRLCEIDEVS